MIDRMKRSIRVSKIGSLEGNIKEYTREEATILQPITN